MTGTSRIFPDSVRGISGAASTASGTWRDYLAWNQDSLIQEETRPGDPRGQLAQSDYRVVEAFRDGQTELLKAFDHYAQTNDERAASTEAESASLKKRLAIAESRITDIERRLNWPPPTQTH